MCTCIDRRISRTNLTPKFPNQSDGGCVALSTSLKVSDLRNARCLIWWDIADDNYGKLKLESCNARAMVFPIG